MTELRPEFILIAVILMVSSGLHAAVTNSPPTNHLPEPQLNLKPDDVVRIVVDALANNDIPYTDAGIATTFNFASPANKANTGPLEKFTVMVKGPGYGLMVDHVSSEFSEVVYKDAMAYQIVKLVTRQGSEAVYAFRLSKQNEGNYQGMWMTDAVWQISSQSSF